MRTVRNMTSAIALCAVLLAFTTAATAQEKSGRLEGCLDPAQIAKALSEIRKIGWNDVTFSQLVKIWPNELEAVDCNPNTCSSALSRDRIISGQIECNEAFSFDDKVKPGQASGQLHSIAIFFSAHKKDDVISAAKKILAALGASSADLARTGARPVDQFSWDINENKQTLMFVTDVHINQVGELWQLFVSTGRYVVDPPEQQSDKPCPVSESNQPAKQ